jgi:hypothetical protein
MRSATRRQREGVSSVSVSRLESRHKYPTRMPLWRWQRWPVLGAALVALGSLAAVAVVLASKEARQASPHPVAETTSAAVEARGARPSASRTTCTGRRAVPVWRSSFESGNFREWSQWGKRQRQWYPVSRVVDPVREGIPRRHGRRVARFEVTDEDAAAGRIHAKVYKWWGGPPADVSGTYRASFYVPRDYRFRADSWGANIFQWKEEYVDTDGGYRQDPQWVVALGPARWYGLQGLPRRAPVVTLWTGGRGRTPSLRRFPLARWVEVCADLYQGERINVYIDGRRLAVARARQFPVGPSQGSRSLKWIFGVGNYGRNEGPIYVDAVSYLRF